jgi:hypothetical protein
MMAAIGHATSYAMTQGDGSRRASGRCGTPDEAMGAKSDAELLDPALVERLVFTVLDRSGRRRVARRAPRAIPTRWVEALEYGPTLLAAAPQLAALSRDGSSDSDGARISLPPEAIPPLSCWAPADVNRLGRISMSGNGVSGVADTTAPTPGRTGEGFVGGEAERVTLCLCWHSP